MWTFLLGCAAGLRSLTAPALVCWAAHFGWIRLTDTELALLARPLTVTIFTVLALIELVADKLPRTPARIAPVGLVARIFLGGGCGFAVAVSKHVNPMLEVIIASVGSVIGAFVGYKMRRVIVSRIHFPDFAVALVEDATAIVLGFLALSRV